MGEIRFTLERGSWYALTMYPGYSGEPYRSPIRVKRIKPLGTRLIEIEYLNAGYAAGVQMMIKAFRVHRRGERHLILDELENAERTVILKPLTDAWIDHYAPLFDARYDATEVDDN